MTAANPASNPAVDASAERPVVAIISNAQTPYRTAVHRRIDREMPEIRLVTAYTHDVSNAPWAIATTDAFEIARFGQGQHASEGPLPRYALREWRKGGRIIQWLRQRNARAVVLEGYNDPGRLRILHWCHRHGVPCFLFADSNIKGDHTTGAKAIVKRALLRRVIRWSTFLFPCGTLGRDYFIKYGATADRVIFYPYEPDYPRIQAAAPDHTLVPPGRRAVLFCGRLIPEKRPDMALRAFIEIAAQRPEWDMLFLGDGPLRESLEAEVPEAVRPRIRWLGFYRDPDETYRVFKSADVLVLPSDYEPWGVVINEAVAAGLAVVASDKVGAAAELVRDGVNGKTFAAGNDAHLASCLLSVTDEGRIDQLRADSASLLAQWRSRSDPLEGLRSAMAKSSFS
ncbi:MAG TPA: glycosyltransferase family 4 protein [Tepidisphaeraceae bacterium]|jgi:glycosyltransferase involved in cell wall biosynthesis